MTTDAQRYDVQLDANMDLAFGPTGDFIMGPSDEQHICDSINAAPNTWKEYPDTGLNIRIYLGGNVDPQVLAKNTKLQLQLDGYQCSPICNLSTGGGLYLAPNVTLNNGQALPLPLIPLTG